jgi:hypothetical protein
MATDYDDEARIEALIQAERNATAPVAAETSATTQSPTQTAVAPPVAMQPSVVASSRPASAAPAPPFEPVSSSSAPVDADAPQELRFDDLKKHVGEVLYIVMTNGAKHYAEVQSANAKQVTLRMRQAGGTAMYTLERKQIARIEPR